MPCAGSAFLNSLVAHGLPRCEWVQGLPMRAAYTGSFAVGCWLDPLTILYGSTARSGEILAKTAVAPSEATVVEGESAMRGQA